MAKSPMITDKLPPIIKEEESLTPAPIHSVRVYQAVLFEKANETFFSTETAGNKKGKNIEILPNLGMVRVSSALDDILVPFTNVSCVYLLSEIKKRQIKTNLHNSSVRSQVKVQDIRKSR